MTASVETVRHTWNQVQIKSQMGLFRGDRTFRMKFHWRFWKPLKAVGGRVWFGWYGENDVPKWGYADAN